jgi:hypothetical protein
MLLRLIFASLFIIISILAVSNQPDNFRPLIRLILIAWSLHVVNWTFGGGLSIVFGIHPRQIFGLPGIVLSHFLHYIDQTNERYKNYHLNSSTVEFWVLGGLIASSSQVAPFENGAQLFEAVTLSIALINGVGTWLFGREGIIYLGAQGLIVGYAGFLLVYGIHLPIPEELFVNGRESLSAFGQLFSNIFTGPGHLLLLLLGVISLFFFDLKAQISKGIEKTLGLVAEAFNLTSEGEEVPTDLNDAIKKEENLLTKILTILLLQYPESALCGLFGGLFTAYWIMGNA